MSRILNYIAKYDENLTIAQLKEVIKQDEISAKQKEAEEIERVKEDFKDVYLKRIYDCALFGETLQVFHILEIVGIQKTTDYTIVYNLKANRLSFDIQGVNYTTINGDSTYHTFSEEELRGMTKISIYSYNNYKHKCSELSNELRNLIIL